MSKRGLTETVRSELQRRYWRARVERDARQRAVYAAYPELEAIDRDVSLAGLALWESALQQKTKPLAELEAAQARWRAFVTAHGIDDRYAEIQSFCALCGDTGDVDGELCACAQELQLQFHEVLFDVRLNPEQTFAAVDLSLYSDLTDEGNGLSPRAYVQKMYRRLAKYVDIFPPQQDKDLLFTGANGRGKTFALNVVGNALEAKGFDVCFVTANQLFSTLAEYRIHKESFRYDPEGQEAVTVKRQAIYESTALLIDDLGREVQTQQAFADLIDLLDVRKLNRLCTLVTTNQSLEDLAKHYDGRVASRLGQYRTFTIKGDDLRLLHRKK